MRQCHPHRRPAARRGAALIEFGLMLVVMVPLLFGIADFSRLFYAAIEVRNAALAGAEYGVFSIARAGNGQAVRSAARTDAGDLTGLTVTSSLTCRCPASQAPVSCSVQCSPGVPPMVRLNVVASQQFNTLFRYPGLPDSVNLRASAVMRAQ